MSEIHAGLGERWNALSRARQILNIVSELTRTSNSVARGNPERSRSSLERALELVDFTLDDRAQWSGNRLRELARWRELLAEFYIAPTQSNEQLHLLIHALLTLDAEAANSLPRALIGR